MATKKEVLEKLQFDPTKHSVRDRIYYASSGMFLSTLVNDPIWQVRLEVAYLGYGLDKLIFDDRPEVSKTAYNTMLSKKRAGDITGIKLLKKEEK